MPCTTKKTHLFKLPALLLVLAFAAAASAYDFPGWQHGAAGHRSVFTHAQQTGEPVIVYFNADWCGYCKKLNSDYLETPAVSSFLAPFTKVEIKPDLGDEEKKLQDQYAVAGYPSFLLVIPQQGSKVKSFRIHPFGGAGNMTPADFIGQMQNIIATHYNTLAQSAAAGGDTDSAVKYYAITLQFVPDNMPANFNLARIYHEAGNRTGNLDTLRKAKEHYQNVLRGNPSHAESKRALHSLKNL